MKKLILFPMFVFLFITFSEICIAQNTYSDDGYLTYSTENHPKANGLKITMKYPSDWEAKEGDHPHIVQKFTSPSRLSIFMIQIRKIPAYITKTFELIDENNFDVIFDVDVAKEIIPQNAKIIDKRLTKIEGLPTVIIEYSNYFERAEIEIYTQNIMYIITFKKNAIFFMGTVADAKGYENRVKNRMKNEKITFQQMVNSVIIHNKWEEGHDNSSDILGFIFLVIVGAAVCIAIIIYRKSAKNKDAQKNNDCQRDQGTPSVTSKESEIKKPEYMKVNEEAVNNNYLKNMSVVDSSQNGRIGIGRVRYLLNLIVSITIAFLGLWLVLPEDNIIKSLIGSVLVILSVIILVISTIKRLKNIGYSPWWTLLLPLHAFSGVLIFICLVFRENYSVIKKHDLPAKIVIFALISIFLIGIILAFLDM